MILKEEKEEKEKNRKRQRQEIMAYELYLTKLILKMAK